MQNLLIQTYSLVNSTGLLKSTFFFSIFRFFYFAYKKYFEDPYYQFCKKHLDIFQNGYILDVGANIGYTTSIFEMVTGDKFKVFSFEPELNNFQWLLRMSKKRNSRIEAIHSAVGNSSGTCILEINKDHHADHSVYSTGKGESFVQSKSFQTVAITSLDEFASCRPGTIDKIAFVKIDVQGFEMEVLKGMTRIMELSPNLVISLEITNHSLLKYEASAEVIFNFFKAKGFFGGIIQKNGLVSPITSSNGTPYYDVIFSRNAAHFKTE
jgi:FkbM family methyltransferase